MDKQKQIEEIVKDIERSTGMPSYWKGIVLDLIHRLQDEKTELQKQVDKAWWEVGKMCMEERTNTAKEILELSKSTPTYCNFVKVVKERYGVDLK